LVKVEWLKLVVVDYGESIRDLFCLGLSGFARGLHVILPKIGGITQLFDPLSLTKLVIPRA
jgi:hypothetical protein